MILNTLILSFDIMSTATLHVTTAIDATTDLFYQSGELAEVCL